MLTLYTSNPVNIPSDFIVEIILFVVACIEPRLISAPMNFLFNFNAHICVTPLPIKKSATISPSSDAALIMRSINLNGFSVGYPTLFIPSFGYLPAIAISHQSSGIFPSARLYSPAIKPEPFNPCLKFPVVFSSCGILTSSALNFQTPCVLLYHKMLSCFLLNCLIPGEPGP